MAFMMYDFLSQLVHFHFAYETLSFLEIFTLSKTPYRKKKQIAMCMAVSLPFYFLNLYILILKFAYK